jgi:hypothetical protein
MLVVREPFRLPVRDGLADPVGAEVVFQPGAYGQEADHRPADRGIDRQGRPAEVEDVDRCPPVVQSLDRLGHVAERPAEAVHLGHDDRIAGTDVAEQPLAVRSLVKGELL